MPAKSSIRQNKTKVGFAPKQIRFEFSAPEAQEVFVTGEFNNWDTKAAPMKKDVSGMWKATIPLRPGRYEYRFVSDGNWKTDPSCSGCAPNNFGSLNCVRIVV
jgi:1,4-alpha-glucan branching enzyme